MLALIPSIAHAKDKKHWQRVYCVGMELEHRLSDGARVDCLNGTYAIEVDYVDHWAESVGQALYLCRRDAPEARHHPAVPVDREQAHLRWMLEGPLFGLMAPSASSGGR